MALPKTAVNLHKEYKRIASTILDKQARRTYLDLMINAEESFMSAKNRKFSDPATSQKARENREAPKE